MKLQLNHSQQKFLFLLGITAIYTALIVSHNFLDGPKLGDEGHFWKTSLTFSDRLIPTIDSLRNYGELNTPLPFIIYGVLEYFFHQGIFAGRLLNLILSLSMVFIIGFPSRDKGTRAILCAIGLFVCPSFIRHGALLYTDLMACFWVLMGFVSYIRSRHLLSCIAFILAIASRQYMLAFPAAIAFYEFIVVFRNSKNLREFNLANQWRWIAPSIAALSIFGWIYLFQGLAPETAIEIVAPVVQKNTWTLQAGGAINFLAFVGLYIVLPEFFLFSPVVKLQVMLKSLKQHQRKIILIAAGLLLFFLVFPPFLIGWGKLMQIVYLLPSDILKFALLYSLSLLTCLRFSQPNLMSLVVLFNTLIMLKAYPWEKYIMPLAVVFWYLKSVGLEQQFNIFKQQGLALTKDNTALPSLSSQGK